MKEILMLAETQGTADYVSRQLSEIFSPYASLTIVIADSALSPHSLSASLAVIISKVLEEQMLAYIKPGTPILIADRMVDPREATRLYDIPAGSDVLVVNTSPKVTEEAIQQLMACGVDDLRYHAYYPGISSYKKDCRYAVTFGEAQLIPPGAYEKALDLHSRPVGISTCVRIAGELGIYDQMRKTLSSLFISPLIRTARDLAITSSRNKHISDSMQKIIDHFQDGVAVVDERGTVTFFNDIARRVLRIRNGTSSLLQRLLADHPLTDSFFEEIHGSNYYFEPVHSQLDREKSIVLIIRDVKKIEGIETRYRRTLSEKGLTARYTFQDIIYRSASMGAIVEMAKKFALGDSTVFIHGPSGCGKEMLAQAIHNASPRSSQPFVAVNFASISASLSDSELFGYEEGAFTGARRGGKPGLFQLAHRGTIFLDEIGDAPPELQKKLLRVIQERQVLPVGGTKLIPVDVRIITASNQDMNALIRDRQFREDLYYRLNVLPLYVPPLRERSEDILPLFLHFLYREFSISPVTLDMNLQRELEGHPWNGNVRELRNAAEYISNFASWDSHWTARIHSILSPREAAWAPPHAGSIAGAVAGADAGTVAGADAGLNTSGTAGASAEVVPGADSGLQTPPNASGMVGASAGAWPHAGSTAGSIAGAMAGMSAGAVAETSNGAMAGMSAGAVAETSNGAVAGIGAGAVAETSNGAVAGIGAGAVAETSAGAAAVTGADANADLSPLLAELETHGDLRHFHRILSVLDQAPYRWSRQTITERLAQSAAPGEISPSDSQIKRDLLLLKNLGLVSSVTGKGTFIKETGRKLLYLMERR